MPRAFDLPDHSYISQLRTGNCPADIQRKSADALENMTRDLLRMWEVFREEPWPPLVRAFIESKPPSDEVDALATAIEQVLAVDDPPKTKKNRRKRKHRKEHRR
jgi:hypothetical protein